MQILNENIGTLLLWKEKYLEKDLDVKGGTMRIQSIVDIEETFTSPCFGMKGNVDVTLHATTKSTDGLKKIVIPLEIKSGRNNSSLSHRAQAMLYSLMISEKYGAQDSTYLIEGQKFDDMKSFLYYLKSDDMAFQSFSQNDLRSILISRNQLAKRLHSIGNLPDTISNNRVCSYCAISDYCGFYAIVRFFIFTYT